MRKQPDLNDVEATVDLIIREHEQRGDYETAHCWEDDLAEHLLRKAAAGVDIREDAEKMLRLFNTDRIKWCA